MDVTVANHWFEGPRQLVETNPSAVPNPPTSKDQGHATLARAEFLNSHIKSDFVVTAPPDHNN